MYKTFLILIITAFNLFKSSAQDKPQRWLNVNYADDGKEYHNLDVHLPEIEQPAYKVVVVIYGSAWFGNNFKQAAFDALGKPLLESGFAVVPINHRSSSDAPYPAQINDVKAAIRFLRAHADRYRLDTSFIGITGYSSGGHLASLAGTSNFVKEFSVGKKKVDIEGSTGRYPDFSSSVNAVVDWFGPIDMALMDACEKPKEGNSPEAALIRGKCCSRLVRPH